MTDDLAQRAARHQPVKTPGGTVCAVCDEHVAVGESHAVRWPCDAHDFAAALVAQEGQADPQADLSTAAIAQRAPFAYGQWRVDLATLLERLAAAEAEADRWCLTATAEKRKHEQLAAALAAEQAARARIDQASQRGLWVLAYVGGFTAPCPEDWARIAHDASRAYDELRVALAGEEE